MRPSARLFHCARCHGQVILCRACDRGHVYCGKGCAQAARRASLQRAGARYRRTRRGRLNNAERQRRFRARRQKVTHHRSVPQPPPAVLPDNAVCASNPACPTRTDDLMAIHCQHCGREVDPFLRRDYLTTTVHRAHPP
jgi:hypothetical protein